MVPCAFDEENCVLHPHPPEDMSVDDCEVLSVYRKLYPEGGGLVVSCWKPTKEEMEEIVKTGRVWLTISGSTMPPAYVSGISPWKE